MGFRKIIKKALTYLFHPIVSFYLLMNGTRDLYIAPHMSINTLKNFSVGNGVSIGKNSRFLLVADYHGGRYDARISIGDNVCAGSNFSVLSAAPVRIGNNCLIASYVFISSENHGLNLENSPSYANLPLTASPVTIGNGCWIGEKASIMPGVTLGDRCVVATNSVVTKSFPGGSMIAGIPARRIKHYDYDKHEWVKDSGDSNEKES